MALPTIASWNGVELERFREFLEEIHSKGNENLIGTFKGNLEEKVVKTNSAGILSSYQIYFLFSTSKHVY